MRSLLLAAALLAPAAASSAAEETALDRCWRAGATVSGVSVNYALVRRPDANFAVLAEPTRFAAVEDAGVVVANGTFFAPNLTPLGDVIVPGRPPYAFPLRRIRTQDGRLVDLGRRWGLGILRGTKRLAVVRDEDAAAVMATFLGGGGRLLSGGADVSAENWGDPAVWGPNFPDEYRTRATGRNALGIKEEGGEQVLLVLNVPPAPGTTAPELARIMKELGASDAVFFDGGGALGFSAGPRGGAKDALLRPSNPGEDLNPTHIVISACR